MRRVFSVLFAASVFLMMGICFYASTLPYGIQSDGQDDLSDYSKGWRDLRTGMLLSIDGTDYAAGISSVTVSKTLPNILPSDAVLYMRSNHNEISCFVNDRELFCEGVCRNRTFGITYTGIWIITPISQDDAGETLTLHIQKTDGNQGQLPMELILANRNSLTRKLALQSVPPILIAVFMIALSLGLLVASFLFKKQKARQKNHAIVWLAIFIFLSGVWMITDDNVPCLFAVNNDAWYFLSFFCFMLLPVPFAQFIGESIPKSRKIMQWFSAGFLLSFFLSVITAIFFSKPLSFMLPMTHTLILIGLGAILLFAGRNKNTDGKLCMPELFWGLCLFVAVTIGALTAFYFGAIRAYALLFRVATFLFMATLSLGTMRRTIDEIERARGFEQLTQTIPGGISRLNCRDGFSILYGNDTYYQMFGYTADEAETVGFRRFDYILLPEDRDRLRQELTDKIAHNEMHFEIEARARHKSGAILYMLTANNYLPEKGEIVSVLTNITPRKNVEEQLRIQEMEFRIAAEQSEKYIMRYEIKTKRLHAHKKAVQRFGVPETCENAEQSMLDFDFIGKNSIEKHRELYAKIHRGDESGSTVLQLYAADLSEFRWYHVDFTIVYDHDRRPDQAIISFYDITQQREKELAYERLRQEAESVPQEQITTFSCNLTQNEVDKTAGLLINSLANGEGFDAYTMTYVALTHPEDQQALAQLMERSNLTARFKEGISSHTLEFRMKIAGAYRWLRLNVQVVEYADNNDLKAFVVIRDINAQKKSEIDLIQRSETDALTGVMNRAAYESAVNALIAKNDCQRHVLVMMDVDHFKEVNDTLGHDMGDRVLRRVADDLRRTLRNGDLLGRLGGDEFSFCLMNLPDEKILGIQLERIRGVLNHDIGGGLRQSVSIGAMLFDSGSYDFNEVYKKADRALYWAKEHGRNRFALYRPDMQ